MTTILRSFILVLILINSFAWFTYGANPESKFVIEKTINEEILTNFDLEQRSLILKIFKIKLLKKQNDIEQLMIDENLQIQFANANGYELTQSEIKTTLEDFLKLHGINRKDLEMILIKNKVEWNSFEKFLYSKALWKKSLLQRFGKRAMITEFELNLPPIKNQTHVIKLLNLSEIVIPFEELGKTKSLLLANRLKVELNAGGDFSIAARRFSRSQSRKNGGAVGLIDEEKLPTQLKNLLSSLSENEIASPIISDGTVILFKLNKREERNVGPSVDYLMKYVTIKDQNANGMRACQTASSGSHNSGLLSKLDENLAKILRVTKMYELNLLNKSEWIILCNRKIQGSVKEINKKKSNYFNNRMIDFSEKLMLELYREAIIY